MVEKILLDITVELIIPNVSYSTSVWTAAIWGARQFYFMVSGGLQSDIN